MFNCHVCTKKNFKTVVAMAALLSCLAIHSMASNVFGSPQIELIPMDTRHYLTQMQNEMKSFELSFKEKSAKLRKIKEMRELSGCAGSSDPGCQEILNSYRKAYQEAIKPLAEGLTRVRSNIQKAHMSMAPKLKSFGAMTTPHQLLENLNKSNPAHANNKYSRPGAIGSKIRKATRNIKSTAGQNPLTYAADLYADLLDSDQELMQLISILNNQDVELDVTVAIDTFIASANFGSLGEYAKDIFEQGTPDPAVPSDSLSLSSAPTNSFFDLN